MSKKKSEEQKRIGNIVDLTLERRERSLPVDPGKDPSGDKIVDALVEMERIKEQPEEPMAPISPELPPEVPGEEPEVPEPEVPGEEEPPEEEKEKKKRALFNTLSELIDIGRVARTEVSIRKYAEEHRDELEDLIDVIDDVMDMLITDAEIYRQPTTFEPEFPEEEPAEVPSGEIVPQGGLPATVPTGGPEGIRAAVDRIMKGEKIDEVLDEAAKPRGSDKKEAKEQVAVSRAGAAVEVKFEDKSDRSKAYGALLQYKGIDSVEESTDNGLIVFTTDTDPEEARKRVLTILQSARLGIEKETAVEAYRPKYVKEAEVRSRDIIFDVDDLDSLQVRKLEQALRKDPYVTHVESSPNHVSVEVVVAQFGTIDRAEEYLKKVLGALEIPTESVKVYREAYSVKEYDGPITSDPNIVTPVGHGMAGADETDDEYLQPYTPPAPPEEAPGEAPPPPPVYKMDVPEGEEDEKKLGDALNRAKEEGMIVAWLKVTPEEEEMPPPPEEVPPEEMPAPPAGESVKEQTFRFLIRELGMLSKLRGALKAIDSGVEVSIEAGKTVLVDLDDVDDTNKKRIRRKASEYRKLKEQDEVPPPEAPPEEEPPMEEPPEEEMLKPYIAVEFALDVELEERERFPEYIKSQTEDPETGEDGVEVVGYGPAEEEALPKPEEEPEIEVPVPGAPEEVPAPPEEE